MNKKLMTYVLIGSLLIGCLPQNVLASGCYFKGYSNYGYSYGKSSYSYGYSSGYGNNYYWPGGYYYGDSYWAAGYYPAGYYPSYKVKYVPTIYKFQAVVPIAEFPTYGAYYTPPPTGVPNPTPQPQAHSYSHNPTTATPGVNPSPTPNANPCATVTMGIDSKLDKLLVVVGETNTRVISLESRVNILEAERGRSPTPAPVPPVRNTQPKRETIPQKKYEPEEPDDPSTSPSQEDKDMVEIPNLLHAKCASCHESKVVSKFRSKATLFIDGEKGSQMATITKDGKPANLSLVMLKRMRDRMSDKTMPPEPDGSNPHEAITMTDTERKRAVQFLDKVIQVASRNAPGRTTPNETPQTSSTSE